jgi:membrane carboxypeptidase/penicillin-binding protein
MMHARHRWGGERFQEPPGILHAVVDPESGQLATEGCPGRTEEIFAAGTEPGECTLHQNTFRSWWNRLFHRQR